MKKPFFNSPPEEGSFFRDPLMSGESTSTEEEAAQPAPGFDGTTEQYPCLICLRGYSPSEFSYRCEVCKSTDVDASKTPPRCRNCNGLSVAVCENPSCDGMPLAPLTIGAMENAIVLVGGRNSGKSVYLAVLLEEMKQVLPKRFGIDVAQPDVRSDETLQKYIREIRIHRRLPAPTVRGGTPRLLHLRLERPAEEGKNTFLNIVLYDPPGEIFDDKSRRYRGLLAAARGVILLVDADQLRLHPSSVDSTLQVVKRDLEEIHSHSALSQVLLAVTLSKFDTFFSNTPRVFSPELLGGHSVASLSQKEMRRSIQASSTELQNVLRDLGAGNLVSLARNHFQAEFFGISSLGQAPLLVYPGPGATSISEKQEMVAAIRPVRVMDPLIWMLEMLGFLSYSS